jgi:hypothetical protein
MSVYCQVRYLEINRTYLGGIRGYFSFLCRNSEESELISHVFIVFMNVIPLLSPVPRTKPLVFAYIRWLSAVFNRNLSLFLCFNIYYEPYSIGKSGT